MISTTLSYVWCALAFAVSSIPQDEKRQMRTSSVGREESSNKFRRTHDAQLGFLLEVLLLNKAWRRVHNIGATALIWSYGSLATLSSALCPSLDD